MSHNQFQFIGNLTRDTEVRHGNSNKPQAIFDIAVNEEWRNDAGDKQERTDFFRIKCFGSQAEAHGKYLGKGSLVFVQGKIRNTKYEKDGQTVYGTDFIADKVDYLDTKAPGGSNQE